MLRRGFVSHFAFGNGATLIVEAVHVIAAVVGAEYIKSRSRRQLQAALQIPCFWQGKMMTLITEWDGQVVVSGRFESDFNYFIM